MIAEKVSPKHPDKIADTIADLIVAEVLSHDSKNRVAVELQLGHSEAQVIIETTDTLITSRWVSNLCNREAGTIVAPASIIIVPQDPELSKNQSGEMRAGDNGIFMAIPDSMRPCHKTAEEIVREIYAMFPYDGKIVVDNVAREATVCWSNITENSQKSAIKTIAFNHALKLILNPLGDWTGGIDVDTGVVNRKLASDQFGLECPIGGGGIHGKDPSKVDFSLPIVLKIMANKHNCRMTAKTSIGDEAIILQGWSANQDRPFLIKKTTLAEIVEGLKLIDPTQFDYRKFGMWGL